MVAFMVSLMEILVVLGLLLVLATFVAGVVLFAVGLVKKRPALWVTGIVLGVLPMFLLPIAGLVTWRAARSSRVVSGSSVAISQRPAAADVALLAAEAQWPQRFQTCTGLKLPDGARISATRTVAYPPPASRSLDYFRMQAPASFGAFLEENFKKAQWADVETALMAQDVIDAGFWGAEDLRGKTYYTREHRSSPDAADRTAVSVAYDPSAGAVYVASEQKSDK